MQIPRANTSTPLRAWVQLVLACGVTLGLLGLLEGSLHLLNLPPGGLLEGDPGYLWWLKANLDLEVPFPQENRTFRVRTNASGLRGRPVPTQPHYTLALGCSTTFGWGVGDEEAWPAQLEGLLHEPVVNGGIPGYSSHQAVLSLPRWKALKPTRVLLAYGIRDSQQAGRPDAQARPSSWLFQTRLLRTTLWLRGRLASQAAPTRLWPENPEEARVPPQAFAQNLQRLKAHWPQADVWLVAFPSQDPPRAWISAQQSVGQTLEPTLPSSAFFLHDPMHLTAEGHRALAQALAQAIQGANR